MMAKNIVVFADGTGNSSSKLFRTNVWRLYQALDTSISPGAANPDQVAYYDDGVGTSTLRPLALLGGAFGVGLKRNILDCYKFICRNYEPGDRIYLFGFSRGAFTARVLAGFICAEGLVPDNGQERFEIDARDAYRSYRRCFNQTGGLVRQLRNLRDAITNLKRRWSGRPNYADLSKANRHPDTLAPTQPYSVEFIGVWDTVAAYGLPIAEMTRGIDLWIWPLSMPDYVLSPKVKTARHALGLDDERDTFHPLLWDEENSEDAARIQQVWFAGVHSDVGGGYPDDALSYKPLEWMLAEATAAGLVFAPGAVAEIQRFAASIGPIHDSRHGVAAYYRYQPRKISAHMIPPDPTTRMMQDPKNPAGQLLTVNIHDSVLQRIATGNDNYAPIVVPGTYRIASTPGGAAVPIPLNAAAQLQRAPDQERVWDWVWHKRVNYFLALAVSLCLAGFPLWQWWAHPSPCTGPLCLLAPFIGSAGEFLPGFVHPWITAFAATPGWTTFFVVLLGLLLARSSALQAKIGTEMRSLWAGSLNGSIPPPRPALKIRGLRTSPVYQRTLQVLKWQVLPHFFGILFLLLIIAAGLFVVGAVVLRTNVWLNEAANQQCADQNSGEYETKMVCYRLRKQVDHLEAGTQYRVTVAVKEAWTDRTIATNPQGFGPTRMSFSGNLLAALRRSPSARWFQPLVKIVDRSWGSNGSYRIQPLEMSLTDPAKGIYTAEFVAPISGEAYFLVNDVLLPQWTDPGFRAVEWLAVHLFRAKTTGLSHDFYPNNLGTADIRIEK